jgi:Flp pilus assembly protein TadD
MRRGFSLGLALCILLAAAPLAAPQATVQEEKQVIKTYPFSGGDPTPIMTRSSMWGRGQKLYPYFFIDEMSVEGKDQPWNVVRMENPYIQVFVLPAEGGKLIGAVEKSMNKDFIYYNRVRKYRQIALRGPWTSGGIEFNFGIKGHQATTATPVDYLTRKNPDGSVSCVVGIMDLPSRTQWRVTITIPPDKAYFETKSLFYNPTPLDQAYYVWMNAANKAGDDLEFVFPGTSYIGHDYNAAEQPWPLTGDGRDLSFYKNHDYERAPGSLFIFGKRTDFAGGYWNNAQFGFGHWALYDDMPGQKFFHWSLAPSGGIWKTLLTDTDGQYFEPQMGRLFDQEDHEFFAPYSSDQWREVWFPYKKIGPMVEATPYGALNVKRDGASLALGFCALQQIDEEIVVLAKGREILRERLRLKPMEVYQKTLPKAVEKGTLLVQVGDKLSYSDNPEHTLITRPINFRVFDETSLEGLYQAAERLHKERSYDPALAKYMACLDKEPLHVRALTRIAEIHAWRGEYEKALPFVRKALDFTMYDPDANYIYGVISRKLGRFVDAKETLGWAARSMKYRSGAYSQMAEIFLKEGRLDLALDYTQRSLEFNASNINSLQVQATTYRLLRKSEAARQVLGRLLEIDPLNHTARFELHLLQPSADTLANFQSLIRNEMPHETYLETALYYVSLGRDEDALKVLEAGPVYPSLLYWRAYLLKDKNAGQSRSLLEKAGALSPYLVFPFREECIPVYAWAKAAAPENWKGAYYLGLIFWGKSRNDEALREMTALGEKPDFAPFYITRGFLEKEKNIQKTGADFEKAMVLDAKDWRNWHQLIALYNETNRAEQALGLAQKAAQQFPGESVIAVDLARTSMNNKRYQDSYNVLGKATILPYEGQRDVHSLFVSSQICLALVEMKAGRYAQAVKWLEASKEYPERLGTGRPYNPDYRIQDTLQRISYEKMKNAKLADEAKKRVRDYQGRSPQESPESLEAKVEQWSKTTLGKEDERKALDELTLLIRGRQPERRQNS